MTLDRCIMTDLKLGYTQEESRRFIEQCEKGIPEKRYDVIQITEEEGGALADALGLPSVRGIDLLTEPALPHFSTTVTDAGGTTRIVFAPTTLPAKRKKLEGSRLTSTPVIDAYIYQTRREGEPDVIITIGSFFLRMTGSDEYVEGTHQMVTHINECSPLGNEIENRLVKYDFDAISREEKPQMAFVEEWARDIKLLYLGIQYALKTRPTLFRECVEQRESIGGERKPGKTKRKVKTYRVITVDPVEFKKLPATKKEHRTFACPCWGVMGHTRRYKSGKEVWIRPYAKGQDRGNPASYTAKEYEIVREVVVNA